MMKGSKCSDLSNKVMSCAIEVYSIVYMELVSKYFQILHALHVLHGKNK